MQMVYQRALYAMSWIIGLLERKLHVSCTLSLYVIKFFADFSRLVLTRNSSMAATLPE
jgi:hypothetical protein